MLRAITNGSASGRASIRAESFTARTLPRRVPLISEQPTAGEASFDLFLFTLGGGRQRTLDEFGRLAESVGFELRSSQLLTTGNSLVELSR
jgi:hypothetical protein